MTSLDDSEDIIQPPLKKQKQNDSPAPNAIIKAKSESALNLTSSSLSKSSSNLAPNALIKSSSMSSGITKAPSNLTGGKGPLFKGK